jgi:hypothetical protein
MFINKIVYGPDTLIGFNKRLISTRSEPGLWSFKKWLFGDWGEYLCGEWMGVMGRDNSPITPHQSYKLYGYGSKT